VGAIDAPVHVVMTLADIERLPLAADVPIAYVTQTTLSLDDTRELIAALERRFASIVGPDVDDICYATQNRQNAVRFVARQVDLVLVVGARNSSNTSRLREVAAQQGVPAHHVQDASEIDPDWLTQVARVGITAGASTPEVLVRGVCERLVELGARSVRQIEGVAETVSFRLPAALLAQAA